MIAHKTPVKPKTKLKIGSPNDRFEHQADRVADTVMKMPDQPLQMQPIEEEEELQMQPMEEEEELQMKENSFTVEGNGHQHENRTSLPNRLKTGLESLSGMDLSGVKVHKNSPKPAQLNALAYTQGKNIYVGPGQEQHLPHEGWHAVQQMKGRVTPTTHAKGVSVNNDPVLEKEADDMGEKALRGVAGRREISPGDAIQMVEDETSLREFENKKKEEFNKINKTPGTQANQQSIGNEEIQMKSEPIQKVGSRNIQAGSTWADIDKDTWRTYLIAWITADYDDSSITLNAYVRSGVYWGWYSRGSIDFSVTINLTTIQGESGPEIHANEASGSVFKDQNSPASGGIAVQTAHRNGTRQLALTPRFAGACNGGSAVGAGIGPYSANISFPDASLSQQVSLGTFVWETTST